jgi:hypothetical protein
MRPARAAQLELLILIVKILSDNNKSRLPVSISKKRELSCLA